MRRDKEEIKSEILRRRDEYKAGRIRFRRTVITSLCTGAATLALVFFLTTRKVPGRTVDANAGTNAADESYAADGAPVENDMQSGGEPAANYGNVTAAPGEKSDEMASDGFFDPGKWICGTPLLEAKKLPLDEFIAADGLTLTRTTVAFAGEEVTRFAFDGEDGQRILDLIQNTLRGAGLREAPVEPENTDCEFVVNFEFIDAAGSPRNARVGFTAEACVLFNDEFLAPTLAGNELHELQTAIEAICAYER